MKTSVHLTCKQCGKDFTRSPYWIKMGWGKFCSNECRFNSKRVDCSCKQCGKSFHATRYQVETGGGKFCSKKCHNAWQSIHAPKEPFYVVSGKEHPNYSERIKVDCAQCGKQMDVLPHRVNTQRYCSAKCYGNAQNKRVKRSCAYCGKDVYVKLRKSRKNPEKSFCNLACMAKYNVGPNNPLWSGGKYPYYGPNWYRQRRAARKRDKYTCQHCGITEIEHGKELDVHHIVPRRKFDGDYKAANKLSNLITLCVHCHRKAEPKD